jgi:hypothetical protein
MLYETGSSITCMSQSTLQTLKQLKIPLQLIPNTKRKFKSANGGKLYSEGTFQITMKTLGKTITYPFIVLPHLHKSFIIGIDFISALELHLCLKHKHFHFQNRCPIENNHTISTVKETFLPANCSSLVQINVSSEEIRQPNICLLTEVQFQPDIGSKGHLRSCKPTKTDQPFCRFTMCH